MIEGADMFVKIPRPGRPATQGMHLRPRQAIKVVELHRGQRRAQIHHFRRRLVKLTSFVVRADDEHAHVVPTRRDNGRPIQGIDEVPMQIDVIKLPALHRIKNDIGGGVSRKADETDTPLLLQAAGGGDAAVLLKRPPEQFAVVNAVQREQIDVIEAQIVHGRFKDFQKLPCVRLRRDFGLNNDFFARQPGEHPAELHFRSAVAASGVS